MTVRGRAARHARETVALGMLDDGRAVSYNGALCEFRLGEEVAALSEVRALDAAARIRWRALEQRDWMRRLDETALAAAAQRALAALGDAPARSLDELVRRHAAQDDSLLYGKIVEDKPVPLVDPRGNPLPLGIGPTGYLFLLDENGEVLTGFNAASYIEPDAATKASLEEADAAAKAAEDEAAAAEAAARASTKMDAQTAERQVRKGRAPVLRRAQRQLKQALAGKTDVKYG